jgi:N-acetyl-anhydromuramyl-L-alanine amidase AmpD
VPQIENIIGQLKDHPQKQFSTRTLDQIQLIVIHHTAISPDVSAARIGTYGVDKLGWARFRYHYYITGEGTIQQTNELTTLSDHAGAYSSIALGVGFAGDFTDTVPTAAQIEAGARLIAWLLRELGLSVEAVWGYKQLVNTQSPGNQWDSGARWGDQLKARIQAYL